MKKIERIFNVETGETIDIERDETVEEQAIREAAEAAKVTAQAEAQAKATAKAALLAQLGITEEQAKLLLS
jgi:hypothetical protein